MPFNVDVSGVWQPFRVILVLCLFSFLVVQPGWSAEAYPCVTHVGLISEDLLGITIQDGWRKVEPQRLYVHQPGDEIDTSERHLPVKRNGKLIGNAAGANLDRIWPIQKILDRMKNTPTLKNTDQYRILSGDDSAYSQGLAPAAVYVKTKPTDKVGSDFAYRHIVYLQLPKALVQGATYSNSFLMDKKLNPASYTHNPENTRSEAVHVNQIGFRPDDPVKFGILSCWPGNKGNLTYNPTTRFYLINIANGEKVYTGNIKLFKEANTPEGGFSNDQYLSKTSSYMLDFSSYATPGTYKPMSKT